MARNLVKATLVSDAKGWNRGFKEAEQSSTGLENRVKGVATAVKAFLALQAVRAVKDFAGETIRSFSDLEQSVGGTEAVFGDASGAIDRFAGNSAQSIGLAESEFRTATTRIGGQLKRMTGDVDFAAQQSIIATQVAADLAATYGGTTADAVDALGAAFRGEADPAERFNLNLKIGAQNAKAVEMGLAATTSQVDENARAQATLALIMEQSADAQGQFAREADTTAGKQQRLNAELEDQKALLGRSLVPIHNAWLGLMKDGLVPVVTDLAFAIGEMTGALTRADIAVSRWESETGTAVETADQFVEALKAEAERLNETSHWTNLFRDEKDHMTASLRQAIEAGELEGEVLAELRDELDLLQRQGIITTEVHEELTKAVEDQIIADQNAARDASRHRKARDELTGATEDAIGPTNELTDATEDFETATERAADAVSDFRDEQNRTINPMFAYRNALRDQEDAQTDVDAARDEYGEGSPQHLAALDKERRAWQKVREAEIELATTTGLTAAEFKAQLKSMGIFTDSEIDAIIADFERVNAFQFASKRINVRTVHSSVGGDSQVGGIRAKGGRTKKGVPYLVGEEGEEVFVPDEDGEIIPNDEISRGGRPVEFGPAAATPLNIHIHVAGSVVTERQLVDVIHRGLREKARHNGGILGIK